MDDHKPTRIDRLPILDPAVESVAGASVVTVKGGKTYQMATTWLTDGVAAAVEGVAAIGEQLEQAVAASEAASASAEDAATERVLVAEDRTAVDAARAAVLSDRTTVAADKGVVAADKLAVAADRVLADAGALTASQVLGLIADSTTSITVAASGDKTFTVPAGKSFVAGMPMRASSKANPDTQFMNGVVKSYSGITLIFTAQSATGSAARADWTLAVTSGALAPVGATQDIQSVARYAEKIGALRAALVPDRPNVLFDFLDSTFFVRGAYAGASMVALIAALSGSFFTRASTATFTGSNGLMQTAATNEMRLDYDPATLLPLGLLVELARTNLCIYSQAFDNAAWTKATGAIVTADQMAGPFGTVTADLVTSDGAAGAGVYQTVTVVAATTYAWSAYVRLGTLPAASFKVAFYDATAGTFISQDVVPAQTVTSGGLIRVSGTITTPAGCTSLRFYPFRNSATHTGGTVFLDCAQIEVGSAPSSYIPTVASTVTRAADFLSLATGAWYSQLGGTLFAEFDSNTLDTGVMVGVVDASAVFANRVQLYLSTGTGAVRIYSSEGSVVQASPGSELYTPRSVSRAAARFALNDFAVLLNSGTVYTDVAGTVPSTLSRMDIGRGESSNGQLNGHVRRIAYFPTALSNAKLQALNAAATWI